MTAIHDELAARASYRYRAARADGALELGVVDAPSREAARSVLAQRGLFPLELALEAEDPDRRARLSAADLATGLRLLADLLQAGLSMARTLAAFEELAPAAWRPAIPAIRQAVREGKSLSSALAQAPVAIPPLVLGLLRAGDAASALPEAVRRSAEVTEQAAATRAALRSALAYPLILAGAGSLSLTLLVGVVIPRFAAILTDLGQALPTSTRVVLWATTFLRASALPGVVAMALLLVCWRAWTASPEGRERWHALLLDAPVFGRIRRAAASGRVCAALAALLESGVPFAPALRHAAQAAGDAALTARLERVRERVVTGARLSTALADEDAATSTVVRLARAGEETGQLAAMLARAAALEDARAREQVNTAVKLLEPALIVGFGGLVALVAAALLQAVYSVRPVGG